MGTSIDITPTNFDTDVLQASYERPVLVDFYATWCGPCQMLKPMLEKLAQEYDFVLAKVDIDQSPELANQYHVEGVPDVRVVSQGEVHPGFVGVLPEPKLRQLLDSLNLKSELDSGLEAIRVAMAAGEVEETKGLFARLIEKYPKSGKLVIAAARFLMRQGKIESAEKLLSNIQENEKPFYAQAKALRDLVQLQQEGQETPDADKTDRDRAFYTAVDQALQEDNEAALEGLLAIVAESRKYRNDGARKAMLMVFELMGDEHPLTPLYRKKLVQTLY
ncbi:tetratricopeptide repeat protein [Leptolyngbya ohadii]|uniref:tetratricopeptide repeat protein n=1 Tax=Leptolyngbya ohadii TaxID=1962290 RepID=UPI000B5A02B6|nr:tetratricopeptide repeat protein [Leptolyngbya ohadii]